MTTKRNRITYLPPAQTRDLLRRLAEAQLGMVAGFSCRPAPRGIWDNVARDENPALPKGIDAVFAAHVALNAAIQQGSAALIEDTARAVALFADELKAAMLAPYTARVGGSIEAAIAETSKEGHEAMHALTLAAIRPWCRAAKETALREVREFVDAARTFTADCERELLTPTPTPQKHAADARL